MKENEVLYPRMQENDKKQLPEINVYGTKVYIKYKGKNKVVPVSDAFLLLKLINIKGLGTSVMFNGKIIEPNQDINLKQTYEEKTKQEQSLPPFKVDDFINKVYSVIGVKAILPKESFYAMKQKSESKRKEEELKTSEHQNKKTKIVLEEESHEMYYNLMHESVKKSPKKENEFVLQNFNKNLSSFFLEFRILFNGIEFVLVKFTDERGVVLKHGSYKDVYFTLNSLQYSYGKIESIKFKTILYENPENFTPYTFPNVEVRKKERLCRKFNDIFMQSLNNKFFYITQTNYLSDKMFVNEENKPTIYKSIDPVKNVSKQKTPISRQEGVPTRSNTLPLSQLNLSNQEMYNKTPKFSQNHVKIQQTEENLTKMTDTKQIFREESKKEIYKNSFKHKPTNEPQKNESFYNKASEFGKNEPIRRTSEFYPMRSQSYYKVREQNILPRQSPYPVKNPTFHSRNISNYPGYPNQANRNYVVNPRVQLNPLNRAPSNNYNVSEQYIMNNNMNNIYSTINPIVNPTINHSSNYNPTNNFNVNSNYNPVNTFNQNNSYNPNIYSNMNSITLNPNMNQNINSNYNPNINANMNVMPNVTNNSLTSNINNHYYNKNMTYHNTPNPNMNINGMNPSANNLVNNNNMMPVNNIMGNNNTVMNNESYNSSYPNLYNQSMGYFNNYNQPKTPYINMNYDYQMNQPINNTQFHPPNYQPMNNFNPYMNYQINNYSVKRRSTPNFKNNEQINYYNNLQGYQEKEPLFVRNDQYVDFNEEHRKIFNQQRNINDNYLNEMQMRNEQQFRNLNDNKVFFTNESQMRNVNERQMRNINERHFKNEVKIISEDNFIPLTSPSNYKPGKISDFPIQEHKIINEESKKNKTPKNFYDPKNDYVSTNKIFNEQNDNVNEFKFNEEMSKPITYPIGSSYPTENTKSKTQRQETNTFPGKIYYNEEEKYYKEKIKKEEKNYKKINSTEFKRKDYSEDKKTKRREIKVEEKLEEIITLEEIKRENELKKLSQQKNDALKSEEDNFDPMPDIF